MRKTLLIAAVALPLYAAPAKASDLKSFIDCLAFMTRWCEIAQKESEWWQRPMIDAQCAGMLTTCTWQLVYPTPF